MMEDAQRRPTPGNRISRPSSAGIWNYGLLIGIAVVVVLADQYTKWLVETRLKNGRVIDLLGGLVRFDYTLNTGAAFGIMRARGLLFALVALAVSTGIIVYYRAVAASPVVVRSGLALVLGGAVGNLVDRVRHGYVVDFIDLRWWPVFNLADSAIVIGVSLLIGYAILGPSSRGSA